MMTPNILTPLNRRGLLAGLAALVMMPARTLAAVRRKQVLAFYYGWYGTPLHAGGYIHWQNPDLVKKTLADAPDYPVGGPYDSLDPAILARHITQAADNGITGLIASWWGRDNRTDQQLISLLDAAAAREVKVTAYIERADSPETLADDILYIHQKHTSHSSWLLLNGKPVIFLFDRVLQTLGLDGWVKARKIVEARAPGAICFAGTANTLDEIKVRKPHFDVLHIYSMQFEASKKRLAPAVWRDVFYRMWVRAQSGLKATTATVLPGYDDHLLPDRVGRRPIVDRAGGATYARLWRAATRADPDWMLIVSFNEWHEDSQLEPSLKNGDRELGATRILSAQFLQK